MVSPIEVLGLDDMTILEVATVLEDTVVLEDVAVLKDTVVLDDDTVLELVTDVLDTGAELLMLDVDDEDDVGCTAQDD